MKAKLVEAGKLVEQIPEILVNGEPVAYRGGQTLPIDKDWGTVGEIYEEGIHYRKVKSFDENKGVYGEVIFIAVPIASESQDDLVKELYDIFCEAISNPFGNVKTIEEQIKSKFTIQRRKE